MAVCPEHLFCLFIFTSAFLFVCQSGTQNECSDVSVKAKQAARRQTTAVGAPGRGALWREYPSSQEKDASRGAESSTNVLLFCTYLFGRKVNIILELKKTITASRSL